MKRSYPTSKVRGSGREYQIAMAQEPPREATPRLRSGGAAERRYPESEVRGSDERSYVASEFRGRSREEIPHAPKPETRGNGREELPHAPTPEARGQRQEELPRAVAARVQEGLEELSHIEGQEGWR